MASKVEEIIAWLAMEQPEENFGALQSHLIDLEQDMRTLVGAMAMACD